MSKTYPDPKTVKFESLDFYLNLAKHYISRQPSKALAKYLLRSEDAVSHICEYLIKADWSFDETKGTTKDWMRYKYANWGVTTFLRKMKTRKNKPLVSMDATFGMDDHMTLLLCLEDKGESPGESSRKKDVIGMVEFLLNNSRLTAQQERCIRLYYLEGMTLQQIADSISITRQAVKWFIDDGLIKIKKIARLTPMKD